MPHVLDRVFGVHTYAMGKLRKLYDWVISWGHSPYGTWALFLLAFAESSFFPIPPDVLLMCLSLSRPKRAFWYAIVCTLGSVLGGLFGYLIGFGLYESVGSRLISFLGYESEFQVVGQLFENNAFLAIVAAAFTPIPYKVFTIAAGVWSIDLITFIVSSIVGRGARFVLVAGLIYFFGERIKVFIDKYFNLLTFVALGLLVGGFVAIKYLF